MQIERKRKENVKSPVLSSLRFQCNLAGVQPLCDTKNVFSAFVCFNQCFMHMNIMKSFEMIHLKYILRIPILIMPWILRQQQEQQQRTKKVHNVQISCGRRHSLFVFLFRFISQRTHPSTQLNTFSLANFVLKWQRKCTSRAQHFTICIRQWSRSYWFLFCFFLSFGSFFLSLFLFRNALRWPFNALNCVLFPLALAHKNSNELKTHSTALSWLHGWLMTNSNPSGKCSTIIDEQNNYLPFSFTKLHLTLALALALLSTLEL